MNLLKRTLVSTLGALILSVTAGAAVSVPAIGPDIVYSVLAPYRVSEGRLTTLFVGKSKSLDGQAFRDRLRQHVELVANLMKPKGQLSYIVYANDQYEVALMQWPSEDVMNAAFAGDAGKAIQNNAQEFIEVKVWKNVEAEPMNPDSSYLIEMIQNAVGPVTLSLNCRTADPDVSVAILCGTQECSIHIYALAPDVPGGAMSEDVSDTSITATGLVSSAEVSLVTKSGQKIEGRRSSRGLEIRSDLFANAVCN